MTLRSTIRPACLALLGLMLSWSAMPATQAQMQVRVAPVRLAPILQQLPLSGTILSPRRSNVAPQESGLVQRIAVDEGDRVESGDILLELDTEMMQLELERLQARQAEAQLLFKDTRRLADEGRRLIGERNISQSEYESRLANEAAAEQRLLQSRVEVRMQQVRLQRAILRAPFAGVVAAKMTEVGEWLAAGSPAFNLAQLDPLRVQARIPERYFGEVGAGTAVRITLDAWPGQNMEAHIDSIIAVSDADTRSFMARMDVPNPEARMAPGMSAQLVLRLGDETSKPVLQVPADAIVRRADGNALVWVVNDGVARPVTVTVGRRSGDHVEVHAAGLEAGDPVVTLGNESLREGQAVAAVGD